MNIIIPEGTKEINENTFENHRNITSVKIPDSVERIGEKAFANCVSLKSIDLPKGLLSIGSEAFINCLLLESISIPDGIKQIEEGTFDGCESLEFIDLPESVTVIKEKAFAGCTGIKNLVIPSNLISCNANSFPYSEKFLTVNNAYKYEKNFMINENNNSLLFFNGKREIVVIPSDVKEISSHAFSNVNAKKIYLNESITKISEKAFTGFKNTVEIFVTASVNDIEKAAFDKNCKVICPKGSYAENWCKNNSFRMK